MANQYNNAMAGNFGEVTRTDPEYYFKYGNNPSSNSSMQLYQYTGDRLPVQTSTGTTTLSGLGGTFTRPNAPQENRYFGQGGSQAIQDTSMGGTWTSGQGGPQISDLPGFLQMKEQQKAGADTSTYGTRLKDLMSDPSKITQTPGYQFAVGQGTQAINRSAAARGQLGGGGVLAELAKYGQGMASQEYGKEVDRLSNLMGQAQQFGVQSGYYRPETYTPGLGISTGGGGGGGGRSSVSSGIPAGVSAEDAWAKTQREMEDYSSQATKEHEDWYKSRGLPVA